jgi:hypothetical protein
LPRGRLDRSRRLAAVACLLANCSRSWSACGRSPLARCRSRRRTTQQPLRIISVLSRAHWVRPELVAEVKYLTRTEDNLLRQVVYEALRGDKPAAEVRRSPPHL